MKKKDFKEKLGKYLKSRREKKGITLEQVASFTKISVRLLKALESDSYDNLPAKFITLSFVNAYCNFVGIDKKDIKTYLDDYINSLSKKEKDKASSDSVYIFERKAGEKSRIMLYAIMGFFVFLGGTIMIFMRPTFKNEKLSRLEVLKSASLRSVKKETIKEVEEKVEEPTILSEEKEEKINKDIDNLNKGDELKLDEVGHKVVFKSLENIWVRYKADEKPITSFILLKDKLLVIKAKEKIAFQASNIKSMLVKYNTEDYEPLNKIKSFKASDNMATLLFPDSIKMSDPFFLEKPLPKTPDPILIDEPN